MDRKIEVSVNELQSSTDPNMRAKAEAYWMCRQMANEIYKDEFLKSQKTEIKRPEKLYVLNYDENSAQFVKEIAMLQRAVNYLLDQDVKKDL